MHRSGIRRPLQRISVDMKYFREKTTGNVLVMGRKTLESFPNQDENPAWEKEKKGKVQQEKGIKFSFDVYIRESKKGNKKEPKGSFWVQL